MLPYQFEQVFQSMGLVNVANKCGIGAVGDDHILQANGCDQVALVFGYYNAVFAVKQLALACYNDVFILVGIDDISKCGEGAHIEPANIQLYGVNSVSLLHHGVVNADYWQLYEPILERLLLNRAVPGSPDFGQWLAGFGKELRQIGQNCFGLPDEHAGIPQVLAGFKILFCSFFVRFLLECIYGVNLVFAIRTFAALTAFYITE